MNKIKAIIQWLVQLELQEHRHWCHKRIGVDCRHVYTAWMCKGVFCANQERKDCYFCEGLIGKETNATKA